MCWGFPRKNFAPGSPGNGDLQLGRPTVSSPLSLFKRISNFQSRSPRSAVLARITPEGLKMLDRLDGPTQEGHRKQLGHLGRERLKALCELLRRPLRALDFFLLQYSL